MPIVTIIAASIVAGSVSCGTVEADNAKLGASYKIIASNNLHLKL